MARPRLEAELRRGRVVGVRLTDAEWTAVGRAAKSSGEKRGAWVRRAALNALDNPPGVSLPSSEALERASDRREARRLGNLLNQALRLAHAGRVVDIGGELAALRPALLRLMEGAP